MDFNINLTKYYKITENYNSVMHSIKLDQKHNK